MGYYNVTQYIAIKFLRFGSFKALYSVLWTPV